MMKILVGYDGSVSADAALDDIGRAGLPREAESLIVSVGEISMIPSPSSYEVVGQVLTSRKVSAATAQAESQLAQALIQAKEIAAKASERVRSCFPNWQVRAEGLAGWPSKELINRADEWKADLMVVGSQGRSALGRWLLGSVSKKVATDSQHSVRVARCAVGRDFGAPLGVMIGVDGSSGSELAVRAVGNRVWPEGTKVRIIFVDDGTSPTRIADIFPAADELIRGCNEESVVAARIRMQWAKAQLSAIGLNVSVAIEKGDPRHILVEQARKWIADSIFVGGRRCSGALERFRLGSVATALATKAYCSVELARNPIS
jgi:nucleotide-binding universal stress UspA family protein